MATNKNGFGIAAIILLLLLFRKKKPTSVIVEDPTPTHSSDADYLVLIKDGAVFYGMDKTTQKGFANGSQKLDGFITNELPLWIKIRNNRAFYYVKAGDFTIL